MLHAEMAAEFLLQLLMKWSAIGQDAVVPDRFQRWNEFLERRQTGPRYKDLLVFHDRRPEVGHIAQSGLGPTSCFNLFPG